MLNRMTKHHINTNYSYETSLPAYHSNANDKQRQQDIIQSLVTEKGTCLKEIEIKLWQLYKIRIPQSTISGRINDLIKENKVMYSDKAEFAGYKGKRKRIVPYKESEYKQSEINFADNK